MNNIKNSKLSVILLNFLLFGCIHIGYQKQEIESSFNALKKKTFIEEFNEFHDYKIQVVQKKNISEKSLEELIKIEKNDQENCKKINNLALLYKERGYGDYLDRKSIEYVIPIKYQKYIYFTGAPLEVNKLITEGNRAILSKNERTFHTNNIKKINKFLNDNALSSNTFCHEYTAALKLQKANHYIYLKQLSSAIKIWKNVINTHKYTIAFDLAGIFLYKNPITRMNTMYFRNHIKNKSASYDLEYSKTIRDSEIEKFNQYIYERVKKAGLEKEYKDILKEFVPKKINNYQYISNHYTSFIDNYSYDPKLFEISMHYFKNLKNHNQIFVEAVQLERFYYSHLGRKRIPYFDNEDSQILYKKQKKEMLYYTQKRLKEVCEKYIMYQTSQAKFHEKFKRVSGKYIVDQHYRQAYRFYERNLNFCGTNSEFEHEMCTYLLRNKDNSLFALGVFEKYMPNSPETEKLRSFHK